MVLKGFYKLKNLRDFVTKVRNYLVVIQKDLYW